MASSLFNIQGEPARVGVDLPQSVPIKDYLEAARTFSWTQAGALLDHRLRRQPGLTMDRARLQVHDFAYAALR
jgi:hypothetical protein